MAQDSQTEDSGISEDNMPKGLHGFMMRYMGHQDTVHEENRSKKSLPVVPIVLIIMVALHVISAIYLSKTGSDAFSINNPLSYVTIGVLFIFAMFKLKHLLRFMHRNEKRSAQNITIDDVEQESLL